MVSEKERKIASLGNTPEREGEKGRQAGRRTERDRERKRETERERQAGRRAERERLREMVRVEKLQSEAVQWLESRNRDRKVQGLSTHRSGGIIFFARVKHLC